MFALSDLSAGATPVFTSSSAASVNEGVSAGTTVYTATATDTVGGGLTYSLLGTDAAYFTINSSTGVITINSVPSYEVKSSYHFTVQATDTDNLTANLTVTLNVNDLAPVISSGTTASVNEGAAPGTVVYTVVASELGGGTLTYSISGADAFYFSINSATGVITINSVPSYETKSSYHITVNAVEASSLTSSQAVTISVNDLPPVITSPTTVSINEGVAATTVVYTVTASEPGGGTLTYTLSGTDASAFSINAATGVVTINSVPSYETKSSYHITVNAVEASSLSTPQAVTITVNALPPTFISGTSVSVPEGVAPGTVVYTVLASEPGGGTLTYSLSGSDAASFNINSSTGVTTFNSVPSYEIKSSYSVTVRATETTSLSSSQAVTINVTDVAPVFSSGTSASVNEGVAASSVIYTVIASEPGGGSLTYSLSGADASAFSINAATGAVTINSVPHYEVKSSYNFNATATEASALSGSKAVTVTVTPVVAGAPSVLTGLSNSVSGTFSFSFTNVAGASFAALVSTNPTLPLSNWTVLGPIIDSPPGHYQFSDPQATNGLRFYTVRSP